MALEGTILQIAISLLSVVVGAVLVYYFGVKQWLQLQRAKAYENVYRSLFRAFTMSPNDSERLRLLQDALNEAYGLLLLYSDDSTVRLWHAAVKPELSPNERSVAMRKVMIELRKQVVSRTTISPDEIVKIEVKPL